MNQFYDQYMQLRAALLSSPWSRLASCRHASPFSKFVLVLKQYLALGLDAIQCYTHLLLMLSNFPSR